MNLQQATSKLSLILDNCISHINYENAADVYFVNKETMKLVLDLKEETKDLQPRRTKDLWRLGKIISKDKEIISYSLYMQSKYTTISSQEKILEYLPGKYAVYRNVITKKYEEYIEEVKQDDYLSNEEINAKVVALRDKLSILLQNAELNYNYINDNSIYLKVVITGLEMQKSYPTIYICTEETMSKTIEGKKINNSKNEHLRIDVPNIILAHENFYQSDRRKDSNIFAFVQEEKTKKAFEQVYFQELS